MKTAYLFPGQGSQFPGMGRELYASYPEAKAVFDEADELLGFSLSKLCFEGPEDELKLTKNTQPALLTASLSAYAVLKKRGKLPDATAGHSLGEYSALVSAGVLSFEDALRAGRARGEAMQKACPEGEGAMAALIGLDLETVERICRDEAKGEVLSPANVNSALQIVVAGHTAAVARAVEAAKKAGAKRAVPLAVSAPFHCALMRPAKEIMQNLLSETSFSDPKFPVIANVSAEEVKTGDAARRGLIEQVTAPVLWSETMDALYAMGVRRVVEVGPGRVLSGLFRRAYRDVETMSAGDTKGLEAVLRG